MELKTPQWHFLCLEVRKLKIKKVDDKPMVIHTKEKPKFHVKAASEAKVKGRNVLTVQRGPKITGERVAVRDFLGQKNRRKVTEIKVHVVRKSVRTDKERFSVKIADVSESRQSARNGEKQSARQESSLYSQYRKSKRDRVDTIGKKPGSVKMAGAIGTKAALDQMEGGSEVYDAYMVMGSIAKPATNTFNAGKRIYLSQSARAKEKRMKKIESGKRIGKKAVKDSSIKKAKESAKAKAKKTTKQIAQKAVKVTTKVTTATVATGLGGVLVGAAAGEAAGIALDKRDIKKSTRNRMIQLFTAKLRQEDNQDSIRKALKDVVMMRFFMLTKYLMRYVGGFLLVLFALVALMLLPVIAVITVIYNSPFAIFFPSISSGETTQQVLSAYVAEFNRDVESEVNNHSGYDRSEKVYLNFEGAGTSDNYFDLLAVYMVKYGDGDTATDMTDKAKENLKAVFDDMCSYHITSVTETEEDEEGNTITHSIKYVNVTLKTYRDMISVYGFDTNEQEILAELMKPEYLAMLGDTGSGGDPGESISEEQYQAIVDAVSDAIGKKVVEFVLSKVGYPYSQDYRDSGSYYDCSSLAYYAWKNAGVNLMYEGANTAASEGKYCYDNNLLVNYDEMQPGDLIFYSYGNNKRFMNITHVAIYVGDGKVVEAANERIGVVYRPVQGKSFIVFIGRPR